LRVRSLARPSFVIPSNHRQEFVMSRLTSFVRNFVKDEEGAALVEYGLLVLLIAVLCIVAVKTLGSKVSNTFNSVSGNLP
jgi:pilus assembly protein Flp/PilA